MIAVQQKPSIETRCDEAWKNLKHASVFRTRVEKHCLDAVFLKPKHNLRIVADEVHPFLTTVNPTSNWTSSRIKRHLKKLQSSQTHVLNVKMFSNGLQSNQSNRSTLGISWNYSQYECPCKKSRPTVSCFHVRINQNEEVLLNLSTKN